MELGQTRSATALIPGSPGAVRQTAEGWKAHGTTAAQVHDQLATLDDEGTWTGEAYDAYLTRFDRQLLHWSNAGDGLREGAHALFTWADALEWAQEEAARAITLWDEAEQQAATALAAHRAYVRELRVGQGLRHPEVEVPFVDPSGPAHEQAREVLFNARATLEVFARDCAVRLDQAAEAARMPLTEAEAATAAQHAVTEAVFTLAVVLPFQATMDMLAVSARTLREHPDIILELLGGAALVIGGGAMMGGGGAVAVTGVGTVPGGGLAWAGAGVAAAGLTAAGHAAGGRTSPLRMLLSAPPHTPRTADGTCSASTTATANAPGSTQKRSDSIVSPRTPARTLSATRSARPSRGITTIPKRPQTKFAITMASSRTPTGRTPASRSRAARAAAMQPNVASMPP
ncbi:putative T7SS-secreted protein [Microbacterium sp. NPDC077057]|uniref:putative T7SS-secreted protein n=1 Tax=unclassified Microbacterium TaxID=2609290 RepID=UPI003431FB85